MTMALDKTLPPMTPGVIYLVQGEYNGESALVWCDDPSPYWNMDPAESVKYLKADSAPVSKRKSEGQRIHIEEMKFGCLQRIADATEVMANNYSQMLAENQNLRMKLKLAESDEEYTRRQVAAQKGLVTKLRNKLAVRRSVESEQSEPIDSEGGHHD
jgi:hypothetical protein